MSATRRLGVGPSDATLAGVPGLAAFAVALWFLAGPLGLFAGVALGVLWLVVPTVYAVAMGHLLLVAVTAAGTPLASYLPAEAGLLWVLFAPALGLPDRSVVVAGGLVSAAFGVALVAWLAPSGVAWAAVAVLAVFVVVPVGSLGLDRLVERIEGGAG